MPYSSPTLASPINERDQVTQHSVAACPIAPLAGSPAGQHTRLPSNSASVRASTNCIVWKLKWVRPDASHGWQLLCLCP